MSNQTKFTTFHRILHWLMALAMPVLFITGFLRMYWMGRRQISTVVTSQTEGISLSDEQVRGIAKGIREPMWQWHEVFAHVMIFAFLARIIYMLVKGVRFPNPFSGKLALKEKLQGWTYIYFYVFVFISAVTGICIEKHLFDQWKEPIETVHKWGLYWFPIFILLHLAGIVIAEHSTQKGIASKMIGGD